MGVGLVILQGQKKKVLKEIIRYFVETTDSKYDDFILALNRIEGKQESELTYPEWLAKKSYELLLTHEITIDDCIENKDIINASINEESSRQEGEFYTPEVWAKDGREYLKNMLGDLYGKAYIWEASCGSGNLLRTAGYPTDKLFMSSLLPEDIEIIKSTPEFQGVEAFQLDFLNEMDLDEYNMRFSEQLPPKLRQVLENNEPLVFYMNPPYKVMEATSTDVGAYMNSIGMAKCALDLFHQFMYRIVLLKRMYKLTNVYLGIFGPVTMFHSKMIEDLYNEFKKEFKFVDGMMFDAGDFSNTSESVGWVVGYTAWRSKYPGEEDHKSIVLDAKAVDADGNIVVIGKRLVTSIDENIHEWVAPKDIIRYDIQLPLIRTYNNFVGTFKKVPNNFLGYIMSSNYVIRATRRASITTLPNPDNMPITEENFWRCVASFAARRAYASKQTPFNNSQYYSKPDTTIEGFEQWVADALVIFLFDNASHQSSYRGIELEGQVMNVSNKFFPISVDIVKQVVTDPVLIKDIEDNPPENQFFLNILEQMQGRYSPEAQELYEFGLQTILESLHGTKRSDFDYALWTNAWDAGIIQIREVKGLMTAEQLEKYSYLISKLKHKLLEGVYKYGFMMDTAFEVEDVEEEESEDEYEEIGQEVNI